MNTYLEFQYVFGIFLFNFVINSVHSLFVLSFVLCFIWILLNFRITVSFENLETMAFSSNSLFSVKLIFYLLSFFGTDFKVAYLFETLTIFSVKLMYKLVVYWNISFTKKKLKVLLLLYFPEPILKLFTLMTHENWLLLLELVLSVVWEEHYMSMSIEDTFCGWEQTKSLPNFYKRTGIKNKKSLK